MSVVESECDSIPNLPKEPVAVFWCIEKTLYSDGFNDVMLTSV